MVSRMQNGLLSMNIPSPLPISAYVGKVHGLGASLAVAGNRITRITVLA